MPGFIFLSSQLSSRKEDRLVPWTSKSCDKFLRGTTGDRGIKNMEKLVPGGFPYLMAVSSKFIKK